MNSVGVNNLFIKIVGKKFYGVKYSSYIYSMNHELKIEDLIPFIGSTKQIEFCIANGEWIKGTIVGIDIEEERVKIKTSLTTSWVPLYFRLNINHPKNFKVKI